jgi:hypothetical protein
MNTTMSVQLPTDTLLKLIEKLRRRGGSQDLSASASSAPPVPPPANSPLRNADHEPGWDLPERRKFRYRLEDVAY